jgi:cellulose synthase/poly-beta-1,6-N-acetylglucosamine synthase-like glycosyltransferase
MQAFPTGGSMNDLFFIPVAFLYLSVVGILFVFGINFFYLTFLAVRHSSQKRKDLLPDALPRVTVQLPFYNELYVAERLVKAAARLDYPAHLLEIQVLDDSTDETVEIIQQLVEQLRSEGVNIVYLHRSQRTGYKAGALAEGTAISKGEFLAIFDADFVPPEDFLRRALPSFNNPKVAFVQARWGHLNPNYSLLTRLQSLAIDAHFIVEQTARSVGSYWFNFNGTAGIWRKQAIQDAGGWKWDTLTEDLDLSYRAFLRGWEAAYLPDLEVPAELPVSFNAYRRQQHRWARGSLECALRLIPEVWGSHLPFSKKIEASLHLSGYGIHLLLFALAILYPGVVLLAQQHPVLVNLFGISALFSLTGFAPTIFFVAAQKRLGRNWLRSLPAILFMTALGSGMMMNTARAAFQILRGRAGVFERTPKYGIVQGNQDWKQHKHYHLGVDSIVLGEVLLAFWNIGTLVLASYSGDWGIGLYALIFSIGLFFVAGMSISQAKSIGLSPAIGSTQSKNDPEIVKISQRGRA